MILENPSDWKRDILETSDSIEYIRERESELLISLNARIDPMSYNQTNGDGKFAFSGPHTAESKQKIKDNRPDFSGKNNPMFGKAGFVGRVHSDESKKKTSEALKGRVLPLDVIEKCRESQLGRVWVNNGINSRRLKKDEIIPAGWVTGLLDNHKKKVGRAKEEHHFFGKPISAERAKKISESLLGHTDSEEVKLKKKQGSTMRPKILCNGCGMTYLNCHFRHHIHCQESNNLIKGDIA